MKLKTFNCFAKHSNDSVIYPMTLPNSLTCAFPNSKIILSQPNKSLKHSAHMHCHKLK